MQKYAMPGDDGDTKMRVLPQLSPVGTCEQNVKYSKLKIVSVGLGRLLTKLI
jgi:hypothetical protein